MFDHNFHPNKSLGQNFITNPRIIEKIIQEADLKGNEFVVEVGPGFGILTEALLKHAGCVLAIEKDEKLYRFLQNRSREALPRGYGNLRIIHADALKIPPPQEPYVLVANIPYSITSPLLDHFIRDNPERLPKRAVIMVQKEVAQKICTAAPRMNVLALHVQTFGKPKIISIVSKNNFNPRPKVDSAIIKIEFHDEWEKLPDLKKYFEIIHRAFSHKRKMMRSMFDENALKKAGIEPTRRPETLAIKEWEKLALSL